MAKLKLIPKPKKEKEEVEKDGRGNTIGTAGIHKISSVRQRKR